MIRTSSASILDIWVLRTIRLPPEHLDHPSSLQSTIIYVRVNSASFVPSASNNNEEEFATSIATLNHPQSKRKAPEIIPSTTKIT